MSRRKKHREQETAVCTCCGETAYLEDDGRYVCQECGNDFDDEEIEEDSDDGYFDEEDYE